MIGRATSKVVKTFFCETERISYRRLLAFVTGSGLVFYDKINSEEWVMLAIAFIAGEAIPSAAASFKRGNS